MFLNKTKHAILDKNNRALISQRGYTNCCSQIFQQHSTMPTQSIVLILIYLMLQKYQNLNIIHWLQAIEVKLCFLP